MQRIEQAPETQTSHGGSAFGPTTDDRRLDRRYPVTCPLEYMAVVEGSAICGLGFTVNISTGGVLFQAMNRLPHGLPIELFIAWPGSPNDVADVKVRVRAVTVRTEGDCTAVRICGY